MARLGYLGTDGKIFNVNQSPQKKKKNEEEISDVTTVKVNKPTNTLTQKAKELKSTIDNSAVKNNGLNYANAVSDVANIYDAYNQFVNEIPGLGAANKIRSGAVKTTGNVATNMGTGALKSIEGAADTISDLVVNPQEQAANYISDYVRYGKKRADENLKDLKEQQKRDIKNNMTQGFQEATGYTGEKENFEKGSLVKEGNIGGQVSQGVGGMVPALVLGNAFGGAEPALQSTQGLTGSAKAKAVLGNIGKTYASQMPANLMLGASAYGGGMEEALNDGANMNQARLYGLTNAAIEQGTEYLTGGIPGLSGKGGIDQYVEPLINRNTNGYLNALLRTLYRGAGEGLEEFTSGMLDPLAKKIYSNEKIDWKKEFQNALREGAIGSLTGALLNAPQSINDFQNVRAENQIRNAIGDAEYAEGNSQYNPDYKGWENQRDENRVEEERRKTETKQRNEEVERIQTERAQKQAVETQREQDNTIKQEPIKRPVEDVSKGKKTQDIKQFSDVKEDYKTYYTKSNLKNFDSTILNKAKEVVEGSKRYGRTKQQWLDVADNIGTQLQGKDINTIKKYAFESFKDQMPNRNFNKQGKGYQSFGIHEWVQAVYNGAKVGKSIDTKIENTKGENNLKQKQLEIINNSNPMSDEYHVGIRNENDIKTFDEAIQDDESFVWGDYSKEDAQRDLEKGTVTVYSSKPIEQGAFVSTSQNQARDYAGGGEVYSQEVPINDVAWINGDEGQYAKTNDNIAEKVEEPVLKIETPQQEKQHFIDNGMNEETAKILSEMPKVEKQPLRERIKEGKAKLSEEWSYLKRNLVDKGETIYTIGKKTKNPNLYAKYDKRGTTTGEANYDIGVAQTDLQGKRFNNFTDENGKKTSMSLNQIWEGVNPEVANEYLAHYLNVDRYNQTNQDGTKKYVFGESITDEDSLQRVKELEKEYPELIRFGNNVWQYGKNQLQNMVDAGKISQEQADQFLKDTPHYVRLQRNVEKTSSPLLEFDKKGNVKVNKNIKEFKGSTLDILPFKESMAQYTLDVRNGIRDNIFAQELAKTLGIDGNGEMVTDIDDMMGTNPDLIKDNGDGTYSLTFFNKGVATTIPINQGIYESLQPNKHYKFEDTLPFKGIRKFDNVRKALLTDKNPMFLATNMMKDAFDAPLNSKYPASFIKNYPRAFYEILKNGKNYQQYQALGGLQNTYFENQQFQKQGSKANPLTWIEKANNAIEQIPRLAEFMSTMEKTGDVDQAMYNAAEVTTNFKRGGDVTKAANRNGATFLNASVQGFSKQIRNFTDIQSPRQAVQMLGKILALGIAPGLLNDLMWDDDDEYKDMQDYQKDRYYLFKGKDGQWVRIPKGRAVSIFQSAARRTKYALGGQKDTFKDFGKFASGQVAPNNPFENNIISPFIDVARNESWSGNPIVSESVKNETHPEEEYTIKTDEFSKWLGKKIGKSPAKINYLIDQYSGALGDIVLPNITKKVTSKNDNVAENLLLNPLKDKFTTNAVTSSKSQNDFYEALSKAENNKKWSKATDEDKARYKYLYNKNLEISEIRKEMIKVQESNKSNKEKYKEVMDYTKEINKISKEAVENSNKVKKPSDNEFIIGDKYYTVSNGQVNALKDETVKQAKEYGLSVGDYTDITSHYGTIKADKDENGKTIPGSKKQKFIDYVEAKKELSEQQKITIIQKYYKKYTGE